MDYTFGGKYIGSGSRGDINSYTNTDLAGTVSAEPRQVNARMYSHVSSRGSCLGVPSGPITITPSVSFDSASIFYFVTFVLMYHSSVLLLLQHLLYNH